MRQGASKTRVTGFGRTQSHACTRLSLWIVVDVFFLTERDNDKTRLTGNRDRISPPHGAENGSDHAQPFHSMKRCRGKWLRPRAALSFYETVPAFCVGIWLLVIAVAN